MWLTSSPYGVPNLMGKDLDPMPSSLCTGAMGKFGWESGERRLLICRGC